MVVRGETFVSERANAMYYEADKHMYENKKIYHDSLR